MKAVRGLAVPLLALTGCAAGESGGDGTASCAYLVRYEGRTYSDRADVDFEVAGHIGTAVLPPCDDTPNAGEPGSPATSVEAYRVVGWDPGKAIAVGTSPKEAVFVRVSPDGPSPRRGHLG
ncbi:DUF6281 family protein [Streptomyces sp.]|uniref:DUF6281 family protein n=1 Tax=Streptomyces sp. TaxID=1931 RepID=UPI002D424F28|nr:DUF6281 family protein [Streptomyces sp.]HZF91206.1 DUF6281 family protein [Streptomyces sp.]